MALALYRRYRPRTFAEVIGQEHVTEPLTQALRSGRLHHAYLFSGPRGCGKTSSARILARSLNCEQGPTPEPCGACASCRSLTNDGAGSIDVIEIDAASHGGVDDARELREKAFFAPVHSRYKIYVIDEAHMVSSAGFNALLKLVEEPPDYVKFIFATTEPEKVLGTIRSRTHHYPFRLIPPAVLRPYLQQLADAEGIAVEPAVLPLVVRAGGGSARDTLSVLDQLIAGAGPEGVSYARAVALLGVTDVTLIDEMCDALAAGDGATAFATIDRVAEAGHDPRRFAADLLERLRDLIVMQQIPDAVTKGLIDGPADQLEAMAAQSTRLGPATLSRCADIVHNGLVEMRGTTAPRLLLELITARMLLPGADDSAGALLQRLERMERRLTLGAEPTSVRESAGSPEVPDSVGTGPAGTGLSAARAAVAAAGRRAGQARDAAGPSVSDPAGTSADGPAEPPGALGGSVDASSAAEAVGASSGPSAPRPDLPAGLLPDAPGDVADDLGATPPSSQLSAAAVREVWPEIITAVARKSKKIAALASGATVRDLDGETVVLTFRFPTHARMVTADSTPIVEALYEALGGKWQIRCDVSAEAGGGTPASGTPARPATSSPAATPPAQPATRSASASPSASVHGSASTQAESSTTSLAVPTQPSAPVRSVGPARQREAEVSRQTSPTSDDDWPEPVKPGGGRLPTAAPSDAPASASRNDQRPTTGESEPANTSSHREWRAADEGRVGQEGRADDERRPDREGRVGQERPADQDGHVDQDGRADQEGRAAPGRPAEMLGGSVADPAGSHLHGQPSAAQAAAPSAGHQDSVASRRPAGKPSSGLAAARAAAAAAAEGRHRGAGRAAASSQTWSDGSPTEEPPDEADSDEDPYGGVDYAGFDPGDAPTDVVIDEKTARQNGEQQARQVLLDAFAGTEQIEQHG